MQEISTFVILRATSTDKQEDFISLRFLHLLASDNTLIILVNSDQMTSETRTDT